MITILQRLDNNKKPIHDVRLLSTDTKPVFGIANGSLCIEIDTGKIFILDGVSGVWHELPLA